MKEYRALASRIQESLIEVQLAAARTAHLYNKAQTTGDDDYWDGVALNLHGFYTGIEQIFEDIARTVDQSVPNGAYWHRDLLLQMSAQLAETRPPVITRETRMCLDEYRGFRHVVRNVYTFHLRIVRVQELAAQLSNCFSSVRDDLTQFASFLERLDSGE